MTLTATEVRQLIASTPPDQLPALTHSLTSQVFSDEVEATLLQLRLLMPADRSVWDATNWCASP
jgi:hypothetical protein